jgi:nitronate monooxygenase
VLVAPMAGGPSTPDLVVAAGRAGGLGFLATGMKSAAAVADELAVVRAAGIPYGVNLFVPGAEPPAAGPLTRYRAELEADADRYGIALQHFGDGGIALDSVAADAAAFAAIGEVVVEAGPPLVSFTFGLPPIELVRALRAAGSVVIVTVTDADEAKAAAAFGADALVVQGGQAGGHASTVRPAEYVGDRHATDLLREIRSLVDLPLIGAGGVGGAADVAAQLGAGAAAVQVGTRFLAAEEAGTNPVHLAALIDTAFSERGTVVTRAFTGRPARAIRNRFTDAHTASAPVGYPAIHLLTAPLRAASARQGDPEALNLWAGTGFTHCRVASAAAILDDLDPSS